jgi:hypothetical protein
MKCTKTLLTTGAVILTALALAYAALPLPAKASKPCLAEREVFI